MFEVLLCFIPSIGSNVKSHLNRFETRWKQSNIFSILTNLKHAYKQKQKMALKSSKLHRRLRSIILLYLVDHQLFSNRWLDSESNNQITLFRCILEYVNSYMTATLEEKSYIRKAKILYNSFSILCIIND